MTRVSPFCQVYILESSFNIATIVSLIMLLFLYRVITTTMKFSIASLAQQHCLCLCQIGNVIQKAGGSRANYCSLVNVLSSLSDAICCPDDSGS